MPFLSLAAPGVAENDETASDETAELRTAAHDLVDIDRTTPLPTLDGERSVEEPPAWWEKVRTYIGI